MQGAAETTAAAFGLQAHFDEVEGMTDLQRKQQTEAAL